MKTHTIPREFIGYPEGQQPPETIPEGTEMLLYEPVDGEVIVMVLWHRYPDYDMIFGVPHKDSPRHEKEIAFFTIRRAGRAFGGHYLDVLESKAMVEGFTTIINVSQSHSPHLWKK